MWSASRSRSTRTPARSTPSRPPYLTASDSPTALEQLHGVGIWLKPAYGPKCSAIEPALERLLSTAVAKRGCWLVTIRFTSIKFEGQRFHIDATR